MYEAAIKRASTGVYFAVPYMAKLIIEFMEKNYQKENRNLRKSRDLLVERILHRYPARRSIATTICSMLWRNTTRIGTNGMSVLPTTRASCANCLCRTRKWERLSRTYRRGGCSYRLCALLREGYARLCRGRGSHGRGS